MNSKIILVLLTIIFASYSTVLPIDPNVGYTYITGNGDVNGDGYSDIAICSNNMTHILPGSDTGICFSAISSVPLKGWMRLADIGDSDNDDLIIREGEDRIYTYYGTSSGLSSTQNMLDGYYFKFETIDFEEDGSLEIILHRVPPVMYVGPDYLYINRWELSVPNDSGLGSFIATTKNVDLYNYNIPGRVLVGYKRGVYVCRKFLVSFTIPIDTPQSATGDVSFGLNPLNISGTSPSYDRDLHGIIISKKDTLYGYVYQTLKWTGTDGKGTCNNSKVISADINGDGFKDIIAVFRRYIYGYPFLPYDSVTTICAFTSDNGNFNSSPDWKLESNSEPESFYYLGRILENAGDINGDGYEDILFSGFDNIPNIYYGSENGLIPHIPTPDAVSLLTPDNNLTIADTHQSFTWEPSAKAKSYTLEVSTSSDFSSYIIKQTFTATSYESDFSYETKYYWRVAASNEGGPTYSETRNFTTKPELPTTPTNLRISHLTRDNLAYVDKNVLMWDVSTGSNVTYESELSLNEDFTDPIFTESTVYPGYTTALLEGILQYETAYYWRVRAINPAGHTSWATSQFITVPESIDSPNLVSPPDQFTNAPLSIDLVWRSVKYVQEYSIEIALDADFHHVIDRLSTPDTVFNITSGDYKTTYYWRIQGLHDDLGSSEFSNPFSFTTVHETPNAINLISPTSSEQDVRFPLTLIWEKNKIALSYDVDVSKGSDFDSMVISKNVTDTTFPIAVLSYLTQYFWRIRAVTADTTGPWSATNYFTTIVQPPAKVILGAFESTIRTDSATFIWKESTPNVESYWFEISEDSTMAGASIDSQLTDTFKVIHDLSNGSYYWRVRARNINGYGPYSLTRKFTVDIPVVSVIRIPIKASVSLTGLSATGIIQCSLAKSSKVELKIYDLSGKRVMSVSSMMPPGYYSIKTPELSKAYYILSGSVTDSDNQIRIKRMFLAK